MAVTIKDVAKLAGVSISTVSRVVNDSKPVSPEARRKVLNAIDVLNYEPNEVARSLVTKKSNLIGVIVDDIGNYYVSQIVRGIEEIGRMYNYDIVLCSSYGDSNTEMKFLQLLKTKQVEGIILVSEILNEELVEYIESLKIQFVYINKYYDVPELPTISVDHYKASRMMMDYLIEMGHKDILYITQEKYINMDKEKNKLSAYLDAIKLINASSNILEVNSCNIHGGYKIGPDVQETMDRNNITAIYCCQDELAIGLMNYLYDQDIRVPDDVSVVGYGDISVAAIYRPTLTTIREPYYDLGAVSIRKILKSLVGEPIDDREIQLPVRLIERNSCKKM